MGGSKDAGGGGGSKDASTGVGFSISSAGQAVVVQGGSVGIAVNVVRTGDQGAITLTGTSLPAGVTASPVTVPAGSNQGTLTLNASAAAVQTNGATIGVHAVGGSGSADSSLSLQVRGPSGSLDTTFGTNGFAAINVVFAVNARASVGPNGVVVAGQTASSFLVAGLTRAAALNTGFGTAGSVSFGSITSGQTATATPPRLDANGRWVMKYNGLGKSTAVRLTATGSADTTFDGDGILDFTARMGNGGGIVPLAGGGYLVGSETSAPMSAGTYLLRYIDDRAVTVGTDDTTRSLFDGVPSLAGQPAKAVINETSGGGADTLCTLGATGGTPTCANLPTGLTGYSLVRIEPGRANRTVAAFGSPTAALVQFSDVSIDSTFAGGRRDIAVPNGSSPNLQGLSVVEVDFKEEIYALGDAAFGATRNMFVARLDEAGNYVTSFGTNGFTTVDFPNLDHEVGIQVWPEGESVYLLFLSTDNGESAPLKGKLHAARLWR
jgi:hypothetical protein